MNDDGRLTVAMIEEASKQVLVWKPSPGSSCVIVSPQTYRDMALYFERERHWYWRLWWKLQARWYRFRRGAQTPFEESLDPLGWDNDREHPLDDP